MLTSVEEQMREVTRSQILRMAAPEFVRLKARLRRYERGGSTGRHWERNH